MSAGSDLMGSGKTFGSVLTTALTVVLVAFPLAPDGDIGSSLHLTTSSLLLFFSVPS